jgi:hypothetical protein
MGVNRGSTNHVFRNLQKDHPDHWPFVVWEKLLPNTREGFERQAKAYLSDRSELSRKTLESADWDDIYSQFTRMQDGFKS